MKENHTEIIILILQLVFKTHPPLLFHAAFSLSHHLHGWSPLS